MCKSTSNTGRSFVLLPVLFLFGTVAFGAGSGDRIGAFLAEHWERPLAAQGDPPDSYPHADNHPLSPKACGQCHVDRYSEWQSTRHAQAMGPGLMAQLLPMNPNAPRQHQACLRCHAPLAEQGRSLQALLSGDKTEKLHTEGLVCAACHVRAYRWYGPPRRDGSSPGEEQKVQLPHDGWSSETAFEDARFCSACHQFESNGYALNGKLLENTYNEWKNSRYADEGMTCQRCHMPDRRHEFKGIHDLNKTAEGLTRIHTTPILKNNVVRATITAKNDGTGHYFPTYITPKVTIEFYQTNAAGRALPDSREQLVVGRGIPLNLREERYDTRLAPGASTQLRYNKPRAPDAEYLISRILVEPDRFYKDFYRFYLGTDITDKQRKLYRQALTEAEEADFELDVRRYDLPDPWTPATVRIPAGEFIAGSDRKEREAAYRLDEQAYGHDRTRRFGWYDSERPRDAYRTAAFEITVTPITNAQYSRFVAETGYRPPDIDRQTWESQGLVHPYERTRRHAWQAGIPPDGRKQHPVVLVSRSDAGAYAEWLSQKTEETWRLPTGLEWEKAARGTDGRWFPWGNAFNPSLLNSHDRGPFDTTPVGTYPGGASPFGMLDAVGQVYEWTANDGNSGRGVVKGGSWDDKGCGVCRPAARHARPLDLKHILIGFRLIREIDSQ